MLALNTKTPINQISMRGGVQHYVIRFVCDLRQVGGFLRVLWFPPPIKLTGILLKVYFLIFICLKIKPNCVRIKFAEHTSLIHYITNYLEQNKTEKKPRTKAAKSTILKCSFISRSVTFSRKTDLHNLRIDIRHVLKRM
jgi:hypothetical protein